MTTPIKGVNSYPLVVTANVTPMVAWPVPEVTGVAAVAWLIISPNPAMVAMETAKMKFLIEIVIFSLFYIRAIEISRPLGARLEHPAGRRRDGDRAAAAAYHGGGISKGAADFSHEQVGDLRVAGNLFAASGARVSVN
jgi:hypothetical protein